MCLVISNYSNHTSIWCIMNTVYYNLQKTMTVKYFNNCCKNNEGKIQVILNVWKYLKFVVSPIYL